MEVKNDPPLDVGDRFRLSKNPLGRLGGPQVRNLNRRGGRWPRPPLVSVDSFGSLCHLRWQQPTGLTLPSVPSELYSESSDMCGGFGSLA